MKARDSVQGPCLLVACRTGEPALALTEQCPVGDFRMGDRDFEDKGFGDWTGFYDWLRDFSGKVVGVRYWPFEETAFLIDLLCDRGYIVPGDKSYLEIYFSQNSRVDRRKSDDQEFGSNKIFCSKEGTWLISFDTRGLSSSERESLRASDAAQWETASIPAIAAKSGGHAGRSIKPKTKVAGAP